jgi:hypothetical protein
LANQLQKLLAELAKEKKKNKKLRQKMKTATKSMTGNGKRKASKPVSAGKEAEPGTSGTSKGKTTILQNSKRTVTGKKSRNEPEPDYIPDGSESSDDSEDDESTTPASSDEESNPEPPEYCFITKVNMILNGKIL